MCQWVNCPYISRIAHLNPHFSFFLLKSAPSIFWIFENTPIKWPGEPNPWVHTLSIVMVKKYLGLVYISADYKHRDPVESQTYIDGLVQDCSISIANALEILQSYTKPSIYKLLLSYSFDTHVGSL